MARVLLFHWREDEALALVAKLEGWGHTVGWRGVRENKEVKITTPYRFGAEVIVFDLSRMPTYAKYQAQLIRKARTTAHIPFVFVEGEAEKVEGLRRMFPAETFTTWRKLKGVLAKLRVASIAPREAADMSGEKARALWKKMNLREGMRVYVEAAPREFFAALGNVPESVDLEAGAKDAAMAAFFFEDWDRFGEALDRVLGVAERMPVWAVYRKGPIKMPELREALLDQGLVDYKMCSVNARWAGVLVKRREKP
jgi:hypothetical protein